MVLSIKTIKGLVLKQYADFILKQSLIVVGMSKVTFTTCCSLNIFSNNPSASYFTYNANGWYINIQLPFYVHIWLYCFLLVGLFSDFFICFFFFFKELLVITYFILINRFNPNTNKSKSKIKQQRFWYQ